VAFPLLAVKGDLGSARIMTLPSPGRRGRRRVGVWALAYCLVGVVVGDIVVVVDVLWRLLLYCFPDASTIASAKQYRIMAAQRGGAMSMSGGTTNTIGRYIRLGMMGHGLLTSSCAILRLFYFFPRMIFQIAPCIMIPAVLLYIYLIRLLYCPIR
jgi:hypothetical protein